jgi:hypothetical protein
MCAAWHDDALLAQMIYKLNFGEYAEKKKEAAA